MHKPPRRGDFYFRVHQITQMVNAYIHVTESQLVVGSNIKTKLLFTHKNCDIYTFVWT